MATDEAHAAAVEALAREREVPDRVIADMVAPGFDPAREMVRAALGFVEPDDPRSYLLLLGGVGTGKSVTAGWALVHARSPDRVIRCVREDRSFEQAIPGALLSGRWIREAQVARASQFDGEFWRRVETPAVLVLDEVRGGPSPGAAAALQELLGARHQRKLKTIITGNLTREQFESDYCQDGGRLLDRLRQYPHAFYRAGGPSLRAGVAA